MESGYLPTYLRYLRYLSPPSSRGGAEGGPLYTLFAVFPGPAVSARPVTTLRMGSDPAQPNPVGAESARAEWRR